MPKIENLIRDNVKSMTPYSSARSEFQADDYIMLDANESAYDTGVNRYPDPFQKELKKLLSDFYKLPTENLFLGNGSDEILDLLVRSFCNPTKDNVIQFSPTYGMYKVLADINDLEMREVELDENFDLDFEKILAAIDSNTKLIFACSPNNPTGNLLNKERIIQLLENFEGIVVVDEAYIDFANDAGFSNLVLDYPNLFVLQTMSKSWAAAGLRLGLGIANAVIIAVLNKIKPPYNINALSLNKAKELLLQSKLMEEQVQQTLVIRTNFISTLQKLSYLDKVYETESNFVLIKVKNGEQLYQYLLSRGIVVRRFKQKRLTNCIRITIGNQEQMSLLEKELNEFEK